MPPGVGVGRESGQWWRRGEFEYSHSSTKPLERKENVKIANELGPLEEKIAKGWPPSRSPHPETQPGFVTDAEHKYKGTDLGRATDSFVSGGGWEPRETEVQGSACSRGAYRAVREGKAAEMKSTFHPSCSWEAGLPGKPGTSAPSCPITPSSCLLLRYDLGRSAQAPARGQVKIIFFLPSAA